MAAEVGRILSEALAAVQRNGECYYEAEIYRLKGELVLPSKDHGQASTYQPASAVEAERYFWQAIEVARQQYGKSLELRAVMSLCRLWQRQGRGAEAYHMLAELYGWFTEGFTTSDLQAAKALLVVLQ
jgi:predicted ATPase